MAKILIPEALQRYTDKQTTLNLKGETVSGCLNYLTKQHPRLGEVLMNNGRLNSYANLYLNGQPLKNDASIGHEDTLELLVSVSGG